MNKEEFINELKRIQIVLTEEQLEKLDKFYELLIEWNKKINLTRIVNKEDVYLKHFYDSLTITRVVDLSKKQTLCDVGTGAGFPGIVLKICFPHLKITLIDSLNKRVNYLNEIIKNLNLKDIKAIHTRAEDYKGKYDVVTSRAVARLDKLVNWCMHLVKKDGIFIAMKANIDEEVKDIEKVLKKNKCKIDKIEKFILPKEDSNRALIRIINVNNLTNL